MTDRNHKMNGSNGTFSFSLVQHEELGIINGSPIHSISQKEKTKQNA